MAVLLFVCCVFASSCAQIILKKGALKGYRGLRSYINPYVGIGYFIFFAMTLCSTYLYRYIPLSLGNLLDSTSYIFVAALSWLFFKETLSKRKIAGLLLIIVGVLLSLGGS